MHFYSIDMQHTLVKEPEALTSIINRAYWKYGIPQKYFLKNVIGINSSRSNDLLHGVANQLLFSLTFQNKLINHISSLLGIEAEDHIYTAIPRITDRKSVYAISKFKRWCSKCLIEQKSSLDGYFGFPLSWSLELSRYCCRHKCHLDFLCPDCHEAQPFLNKKYEPGYCDFCGCGLYSSIPIAADEDELTQTYFIFDLFNDFKKNEINKIDYQSNFMENLETIAKGFGNIDGGELSKHFGFDRNVFNSWRSGKSRPSIESLILFLNTLETTKPYKIWESKSDDISYNYLLEATQNYQIQMQLRMRRKVSNTIRGEIETHLSKMISGQIEAESKKSLAKRFKVSVGFLDYNYSQRLLEVRGIIERNKQKSKELRKHDLQLNMNAAVQKVLSKKRQPTLSNVTCYLPTAILKNSSTVEIEQAFNTAIKAKNHLLKNIKSKK